MGVLNTFSDMVKMTLKCKELEDVAKLVDICGTFQASIADQMNRIKTKIEELPSGEALGSAHQNKVYHTRRGGNKPGQSLQSLERW